MPAYFSLEPDALQKKMAESILLIDVRTDREVERGLIPGALHIPLHMLPSRLDEIGRECPVVLYCQSGARSAQASNFLVENGWTDVYNLTGGYASWISRGFTVTQR